MKLKTESTGPTTNSNDLYGHLKWILRETERIAGAHTATFEEIRKMADYLKDIRVLLNDLDARDTWLGKIGRGPDIKNLGAHYLDIEGKVKELRNDLEKSGETDSVRRAV